MRFDQHRGCRKTVCGSLVCPVISDTRPPRSFLAAASRRRLPFCCVAVARPGAPKEPSHRSRGRPSLRFHHMLIKTHQAFEFSAGAAPVGSKYAWKLRRDADLLTARVSLSSVCDRPETRLRVWSPNAWHQRTRPIDPPSLASRASQAFRDNLYVDQNASHPPSFPPPPSPPTQSGPMGPVREPDRSARARLHFGPLKRFATASIR
jgi:hypothetical protein